MSKKILLFTLQTFSTTGGIQKMTRTLGYSLNQIALQHQLDFKLWSVYDADHDLNATYLPAENFRGFNANRPAFITSAILKNSAPDVLIISHINIAAVGLLIKFFRPQCKLWLIAHGIEVWRPLSFIKRYFLKKCDNVICVSNYTKNEIIKRHKVLADRCRVMNNAIDPLMKLPEEFVKPEWLLNKYGLLNTDPVLFTLTRMDPTEQYKGYEQVLKAVVKLKSTFPDIKYVLAGHSGPTEEIRIKNLILQYQIKEQVVLTGFIDEDELADYFLLADLFVLPSKKEGFGIVFIEALACGLPVICGNADGSLDAIRNGELGTAINTDDPDELENTITQCLLTPLTIDKRNQLQEKCLAYFSEQNYRDRLQKLLNNG